MQDTPSVQKAYYQSPIGILELSAQEDAVLRIDFSEDVIEVNSFTFPVLERCIQELDEYFQKKRKEFSVPIQLEGTDFQKRVWKQLQTIPFGHTETYMHIAQRIRKPTAMRAVGGAIHHNPVAIIVPCHRVIGSNGSLTGYAGGIWRKEWLLKHEQDFSE